MSRWKESAGLKVVRASAWMRALRLVPPQRLATGKFLIAATEGDVSVLSGMGVEHKRVHVVHTDVSVLEKISHRFPGVVAERGEFEEVARKGNRSFTVAALGEPLPDAQMHARAQLVAQHALKEEGFLLARFPAGGGDLAPDALSFDDELAPDVMVHGSDRDVIEWAARCASEAEFGEEKTQKLEDYVRDVGEKEAAAEIRRIGIRASEPGRRALYVGDLLLNRGSPRCKIDPIHFYFYSSRSKDEEHEGLLVVGSVHRPVGGESSEKFIRRLSRKEGYGHRKLENITVDEKTFPELVTGTLGGADLSMHSRLYNISERRIQAWKNNDFRERDYEEEDEMQHEPSVRAALFTKFPIGFIRGTIEKKLKKRGVVLEKVLSPVSAETTSLSQCDVVLDMFEIGSHAEHEKVKAAAKSASKPMLFLSRKEASWPADFRRISDQERTELNDMAEYEMAAQKAVSDDRLEPFLRDFIQLQESGQPVHQMVAPLSKYWGVGSLTNANQLTTYIRSVERSDRCPPFFREWREGKSSPSIVVEATASEVELAAETPKNGVHPVQAALPVPEVLTAPPPSEMADELALYQAEHEVEKTKREQAERVAKGLADEVAKYAAREEEWKREREVFVGAIKLHEEKERVTAAEIQKHREDTSRTIKKLEEENKKLRASTPKTTFSSIRASLMTLVEQDLLTEEEAIQKFWKYVPKEGT